MTSAQNWLPALDYIRSNSQIEDVVVSGGDIARLKPAHMRTLGNALLDIEHVRRIRLATKVLSVQPMKVLSDHDWIERRPGAGRARPFACSRMSACIRTSIIPTR